MPAVAGLRGTGDWATDERPKNFRETILWLNPNGEAPFTALMSRMSSESTDDPEFNWWEETQGHVRVQANGALNDSETTLTVDDGALSLVSGDLLLVDSDAGTGEIVEVTADPSSDTSLTIARGAAGTTAAAVSDDAFLTHIGSAHEEGSSSPKSTTRNPTKLNNYCQIFKTTYSITNTAKKTRTRTGDPKANDKKRKMFDHSRQLEMAWLFGQPHEDTTGSKPKRYTGGLQNFITTNRTLFTSGGTAFTEDNVIDAISPVFDYNGEGAGDERLAFCGNGALTALNKLAKDSSSTRINYDGVIKQWGMNLHQWTLPQGRIMLRTHPLLNIHGTFSNSMFVINPRGIKYRYLRDTRFKDDIQQNDEDFEKGQWLTEAGLEVHHERTMAYLGGVDVANS